MLRLAVFACLLAAVAASGSISGVVEGIVPCVDKGDAEILEVRITDCTDIPCNFAKGATYDIEVDFIPFEPHQTLDVTISIVDPQSGQSREIVHETIPAQVAPGNAYTLSYPWTVQGDFNGRVLLQMALVDNGLFELCGLIQSLVG